MVNAFDYFMLLEQQPLLTQVEQDHQESIQYSFQAPVPETRHIDEFEPQPEPQPTEIIPADHIELVSGPFTLDEKLECKHRLLRVRHMLQELPPPNVTIKCGADGITEYHIRMTGCSFKI